MKQVNLSKQKWFLTAALFTVLAGNYTFQTSSKNIGTFDMSSSSEEDLRKREDAREAEMARVFGLVNKKIEVQKTTQAAAVETGLCTTGECKTSASPSVLLKLEDYNLLLARINKLEAAKVAKEAVSEDKDKKNSDSDCELKKDKETRTEKREREQCLKKEKEEKKQEIAKKKQDELAEKFEDKMDDIKSKCEKDLQCLTSGFTEALGKFDGKNTIPAAVVNKQFKSLIGSQLNKALFSEGFDQGTSIEALKELLSDVPAQYSGIKQMTMDAVRYQALAPANRVQQGFKLADSFSKQNNPQAYIQQLNQSRQEQHALSIQASEYTSAIEQALRESGDQSSLGYYQRSYVPNMDKIMKSMMLPTSVDSQTQITTTNSGNTNTRNTRNGEAVQTQQPAEQQQNQGKITRPTNGQPVPFSLSTSNRGVQPGQPTTTTRVGRGSY